MSVRRQQQWAKTKKVSYFELDLFQAVCGCLSRILLLQALDLQVVRAPHKQSFRKKILTAEEKEDVSCMLDFEFNLLPSCSGSQTHNLHDAGSLTASRG